MAYASINSKNVLSAVLTVPRTGIWHLKAAIDADSTEGLLDDLTLRLDEDRSIWRCRAVRVAVSFGRVELRAVGGAGGFARLLGGQSYRQATVRAVLGDILRGAGEALDPTSTTEPLGRYLTRWTRTAGPASMQLSTLVNHLGLSWRVLPSGRVWFGMETWPEAPTLDPESSAILGRSPADGSISLTATDVYKLLPGMTHEGRRISYIEHRLLPDALRTSLWLEDAQWTSIA